MAYFTQRALVPLRNQLSPKLRRKLFEYFKIMQLRASHDDVYNFPTQPMQTSHTDHVCAQDGGTTHGMLFEAVPDKPQP